jgi:rhamnose transport system permease protein
MRAAGSFKKAILSHNAVLAVLTTLLVAGVTTAYPQFATPSGLRGTLDDTAILILLALGEMLVMLTGAIDLSVAANVALTGMAVALLNQAHPSIPVVDLVALACAIGAGLGAFNGLLVWKLEIPPIVVTLGTMAIYRGATFVASAGRWVNSGDMSAAFVDLVRTRWLGISNLSWFAVTGVVLATVFLRYAAMGRRFYTAGNNPQAAAYVGVNVGRVQCFAFALSGMLAGLSGYLWTARYAVAYTDAASGFELTVIASCVIGGISIAGGAGTIAGLLLGCVFLGVIRNALPLLGVSSFWQMAVSGAVIVTAVVLNGSMRSDVRQHTLGEAVREKA